MITNEQDYYEDETFQALDLSKKEFSSLEFSGCSFTDCDFTETSFLNCRFSDVVFENCHFYMPKLKRTYFSSTQFKSSRVIGVNWTEVLLPNLARPCALEFDNCDLNHSLFIGMKLTGLNIRNSRAKGVDFESSVLKEARFPDTDFTESVFHNTDLTKADFRGARNYQLDIKNNITKKTKFSYPEAMSLLYCTDIIIEDE